MIQTFAMACMLFVIGNVAQAQTPGCQSSAQAASKMWDAWKQETHLDPTAMTAQAFVGRAASAVNKWNKIAKNSWATIGPRSLRYGEGNRQTGTIMGKTTRTFVMPPTRKGNATITLKKIDGRAKTGVTICTQTKNGSRRTIHSYTFNNSNAPKTKTFSIPNSANKVVTVTIKNYSVGNKFKYSIKAK